MTSADEDRFQDFINETVTSMLERRPQGLTGITLDDYLDCRRFVLDDLLRRGEMVASRYDFAGSDAGLFAWLDYEIERGTPNILLTVQATDSIRVLCWRGHHDDEPIVAMRVQDEAQGNRIADRYAALTVIRRH